MASVKALKFENDMLELVGQAKKLVLKNIPKEESEGRQELTAAINEIYERAHHESRQLRKALAFQHDNVRLLEEELESRGADVATLYEAHREAERNQPQRYGTQNRRSTTPGS